MQVGEDEHLVFLLPAGSDHSVEGYHQFLLEGLGAEPHFKFAGSIQVHLLRLGRSALIHRKRTSNDGMVGSLWLALIGLYLQLVDGAYDCDVGLVFFEGEIFVGTIN